MWSRTGSRPPIRNGQPMDYQFHKKGKFALLTVSDVFARLPAEAFQLSDGTWVMDAMPVPDLGILR